MYIGEILKERMDLFGIDICELCTKSFVEKPIIQNILNNKISFDEIDNFDLRLICSVLHCDEHYFDNQEIRKKDFVIATLDREKDSIKSIQVKAKIQDFLMDSCFVNELLSESKKEQICGYI